MSVENEKLQIMVNKYGFNDEYELIEDYINDGVVPGICMNEDCYFTAEYEPDQENGWCEDCETKTVKSAMVLAGIM